MYYVLEYRGTLFQKGSPKICHALVPSLMLGRTRFPLIDVTWVSTGTFEKRGRGRQIKGPTWLYQPQNHFRKECSYFQHICEQFQTSAAVKGRQQETQQHAVQDKGTNVAENEFNS